MKINYKLLVWLLGGFLATSGVVFGVHSFQYHRIAQALLFQANRAEEQGDTQRMVRYLQRYLELTPRDLEEKARLARALTTDFPGVTAKTKLNALYLLDSILVSAPERVDLRRLLIKTALEVARPKMARDHLAVLWKDGPDRFSPSERGELECYWGQLAEMEKETPKAIGWYQQASKHNPQEQTSFLRLACLLRTRPENDPQKRLSNEVEADQLIDEMVNQNKESHQAYLTRWNYRRQFDLVLLETAAENKKQRHAVVKESKRDAGADVTVALQRAPDALEVLLAAGDLERLLQNREAARKHLERGLELQTKQGIRGSTDPIRPQFLWHLISLLLDDLFDEKKTPETRNNDGLEIVQRLNQLRRFRSQEAQADFLEGRLRVAERRWSEAATLLERARANFVKRGDQRSLLTQIDTLLGQCAEQLADAPRMYAAYQRVAEADPNNPVALLGMGSAQWLQGRLDEARENYHKAMKLNGIPLGGFCDIARLEIQRQMQHEPEKRNWTAAEKALETASQQGEDGKAIPASRLHEITLLRVELLNAQQKYEQAGELLVKAIESVRGAGEEPKALRTSHEGDFWAGRARLMLRQKKPRRQRVFWNRPRSPWDERSRSVWPGRNSGLPSEAQPPISRTRT